MPQLLATSDCVELYCNCLLVNALCFMFLSHVLLPDMPLLAGECSMSPKVALFLPEFSLFQALQAPLDVNL